MVVFPHPIFHSIFFSALLRLFFFDCDILLYYICMLCNGSTENWLIFIYFEWQQGKIMCTKTYILFTTKDVAIATVCWLFVWLLNWISPTKCESFFLITFMVYYWTVLTHTHTPTISLTLAKFRIHTHIV